MGNICVKLFFNWATYKNKGIFSIFCYFCDPLFKSLHVPSKTTKELLAIRRLSSLVDMTTNTKFSNCLNVFKIGVVW